MAKGRPKPPKRPSEHDFHSASRPAKGRSRPSVFASQRPCRSATQAPFCGRSNRSTVLQITALAAPAGPGWQPARGCNPLFNRRRDSRSDFKAANRLHHSNNRSLQRAGRGAEYSHENARTSPRPGSVLRAITQLTLAARGPDHALVFLRHRGQPLKPKLLHTLPPVRLGREDITL
jgi:hypothetical protein